MTARYLDVERRSAGALEKAGVHQVGANSFDGFRVQQATPESLTAYACLDSSASDLVDENGTSAVVAGTPERQTVEIRFAETSDGLKVDGMKLWDSASTC
ncbi:hypothetical protein QT381_08390 [Galbitalea sp. SE-J8]|uniref:hypothetical protein n=1 Tax=Galbitalea sp. SE-J8 TaxID=3054952 RepID=UPI00259C6E89|nr:hypothetical protein [Galbitalea sp. SE-J8]MDM4763025.1 hypothetical protein [Galbitalea sp. SE-J8]